MLMRGRVNDDVVDVDDDVFDAVQLFFYESLERGRTTQKTHQGCYPFELSKSSDGESCKVTIVFIDGHLPDP